MALKTSINDSADYIVTKQQSIGEVMGFSPYEGQGTGFGPTVILRRIRNITDAVVVAVQDTTAKAYVVAKAADTSADGTTTYVAQEDNRYCGSFTVTRHTDSRGAWVQDT